MSVDQAAWADIARLWQTTDLPASALAARFGISRQKIVAVARSERWQRPATANKARATVQSGSVEAGDAPRNAARHVPRSSSTKGSLKPERDGQHKTSKIASQGRIVARLFAAVDAKLAVIEQQLALGEDASPADSERTTRALNSLIRSFEKLSQYERQSAKSKSSKSSDVKRGRTHESSEWATSERRREELASRIQRLLDRR
ncbi:MAG: hypothetical protein KDJ37_16325 [Hyphomicrobiaceae bacterium]|nr:hypothetical protein [Hyphomicrobiaceae bacterium]